MPRIDIAEVRKLKSNEDALASYIDDFIDQKCSPDDPPYLSDLILNAKNGGIPVLEAVSYHYEENRDNESSQFRWKIQVIKDEWGNDPSPGDVIRRRIKREEYYKPGKPIPSQELSVMKADGSYEKKFIRWNEYKVDEKGCIDCAFADAMWFLTCFGKHSYGGGRISIHAVEHSGDPLDSPSGDKLHAWYWRHQEASKEQYAELPKIKKRVGHRRGFEKAPQK
jgi:hypothetical protein